MTPYTNNGELALDGLEAMPDVVARLEAQRRVRVADLSCGQGAAGLAIAEEFLDALVDGFDTRPTSVDQAQREAEEAGLDARVRFRLGDAALLAGTDHYELMFHLDPRDPLESLAGTRAALADGGVLVVARERAEPPETLRERASAAGFETVEELPIEDGSVRLLALRAT